MADFTYDCRNRLVRAEKEDGSCTAYEYDAENNRIAVIKFSADGRKTKTAYVVDTASGDLSQVLVADETKETELGSETISVTSYLYAGNRLTAQEKSEAGENKESEYLLYHFNNVGSTVAVTTGASRIKSRYGYTPYGDLLYGSYGEIVFMYNGQFGVQSDANGLYYMRARYYNIDDKRFINQDILTGMIENSQSLNRYAYVEGNPVSFLDPFGLDKAICNRIHRISRILKDAIYIAEMVIIAGTFLCMEIAPVSLELLEILATFQLSVSAADLTVQVMEIVDNWDELSENEKNKTVVQVVVKAYKEAALEVISNLDPSLVWKTGMFLEEAAERTWENTYK